MLEIAESAVAPGELDGAGLIRVFRAGLGGGRVARSREAEQPGERESLKPRDPHGVPPVDRPDGPPSERLDGSGFARAPACYLRATVRTWRRSLGSGRVPAAPAAARRRAPRRHRDAPGRTPGEGRGARPPVAEDGRGGSGGPSRPSGAHRVRASRVFSSPGAAGGGGAPRGGRGGSGGGRRGIREERPVPGSGVHAESHVPSPGPLGSSGRGP